jgi:group I intron endonuclease
MKYYIVYKTTNLINNMYYVGCHQTNNLHDGYIGSGKYLKRAIKKYGIKNFKFEILYLLSSKDEMFKTEKKIVNESLVKDPMSYNLKIGGSGGNPGIVGAFLGKTHSSETKEKIRHKALNKKASKSTREKISQNNWAKKQPEKFREHARNINLGKPKSKEQRKKQSDSQRGKKLVNNGIIAKWASLNEIENLLKDGWKLGKDKK